MTSCTESGLFGARPVAPDPIQLSCRRCTEELCEDARARLVAFGRECMLEVGDQRGAEGEIRLGARDDVVERAASARQLLRGPHPAGGGGAQEAEEHTETRFVVEK